MARYEAAPDVRGDWCVRDGLTGQTVGACYERRWPTSRRAALRFARRLEAEHPAGSVYIAHSRLMSARGNGG